MTRITMRFQFDIGVPPDDVVDVLETSLVAMRGLYGGAVVAIHSEDVRLDPKGRSISIVLSSRFAWDLVRILTEFCLDSFDDEFEIRRIEDVVACDTPRQIAN